MKKKDLLILTVCIMLCFASSSYAWHGRMSGMDNPSSLVADESDFLTHPAKIVDGTGSHYYGDYKFNYVQVPRWDNVATYNNANTGAQVVQYPFSASGSERDHDASFGGTWALNPGRLGLFFQYSTEHGSYTGSNDFGPTAASNDKFAFDTQDESFAVKLIYGLPLGSWKLGTELALAHKTYTDFTDFTRGTGARDINSPMGARSREQDTFPYMVPVDAKWNEASFKTSVEKAVGPGVMSFTPQIATVFHGTNKIDQLNTSGATTLDNINGTGNLAGWRTSADIWYRVKLNETTTLPFVVSVNYDRKRANISTLDIPNGLSYNQTSEAKEFVFEVGGGIDKDIAKGTKAASGLYYDYMQGKTSFIYMFPSFGQTTAHNEYPSEKEHRIVWKAACEHALSPVVTARVGVNAFYGWVSDHYNFTQTFVPQLFANTTQDIVDSGHRWGLTAAAGATVKAAKFEIEPFVSTGIQKNHVETNSGSRVVTGAAPLTVDLEGKKSDWTVSGGVSIKY